MNKCTYFSFNGLIIVTFIICSSTIRQTFQLFKGYLTHYKSFLQLFGKNIEYFSDEYQGQTRKTILLLSANRIGHMPDLEQWLTVKFSLLVRSVVRKKLPNSAYTVENVIETPSHLSGNQGTQSIQFYRMFSHGTFQGRKITEIFCMESRKSECHQLKLSIALK